MKKWHIENSKKSEISEISEKLFRVFLFDLKILEKNFRDFRFFDLALVYKWISFCIVILIIYINMSA